MKKKLQITVVAAVLFSSNISFGQAPTMGNTIDYVLFTSSGSVENTGDSHITGNIGTQVGSITTFGNVDGELHSADFEAVGVASDLTALYTELSTTTTSATHGSVFGTGEILNTGVYQVATTGFITGELTLDAQGNENAIFIFKIGGTLTTAVDAEITLINSAKACNVFWVAEGDIEMAEGTNMKGTFVANNSAITMSSGSRLEGRMFSTSGNISIEETTARLPLGCGLALLYGPDAPNLASTECFALFTGNGALTNTGITTVTGDVGTNAGSTTGFTAAAVTGNIHLAPNTTTATAATDLDVVITYLNSLTEDIELMHPGSVGNSLVLTPHTYLLDAPTVITDTLFLNAQNNDDAVFAFIINGALSTSVDATIILQNGAQEKNVFWVVNGSVSLNSDVKFKGTIVSDNGTINLATGVDLEGRALTSDGIFTTDNITATSPTTCAIISVDSHNAKYDITVYPNPFKTILNIEIDNNATASDVQLIIYNVVGEVVINTSLNTSLNTVNTSDLPSGVYFYDVFDQNGTLQTGRLIAQ